MISRKLYFRIIVHVILIVALSLLVGFLIVKATSLRYIILCTTGLVVVMFSLIHLLNTTNRNIRFFFDSVKNDDSGLNFPGNDRSAGLEELHESMNRVNRQIQQLKIMNRQQEQFFEKVLEHLATGIITYDRKGFIHNANTASRSILGASALTHLQQIDRIDSKLYSVIKNMKPNERRLIGITGEKDEIQLSLKSTSFGTDENELIILTVQDIKHELDEKEIDSWMKLIRVLMHEIMNSITPITSLSESISNIYKSGGKPIAPGDITEKTIETTLHGLEVIRDQGKGLTSFVESYRRLTRIPKPEKKLLKVREVFSRVKILAGSLEKKENTKLKFDNNGSDLEILADENLISLVLINLIKNAIEANEGNEDAIITISTSLNETHPEICVADNGPGIEPGNLDKIFVPFFTTRQHGSGIGLSLSRQIMGAHGGTLKVRSIPGKETVFCMTFRS